MIKLKHTLYSVLCLLIGMCTLSGCIEEYEADISSEDTNLLVVEGTICPGLNTFFLTLSQPLHEEYEPMDYDKRNPYLSDGWEPSSYGSPRVAWGAVVYVRGTDGSEYVAQSDGDRYTCWINALSPEVEYYLHIEFDGEAYESEPQKPLRTEKITEVIGVENMSEGSIDVLVTPDVPFESEQTNYYSWTYDETWEVYPDYTTNMYYDTTLKKGVFRMHQFPERGWIDAVGSTIMVGKSASYEGQHIQGFKLYDIGLGDERIFHRYSALIHQRAITKAEYEYELARRQASTEMGGLFTPQPSALPTNIRCLTSNKHVIGFVGCSLNKSEYRIFLDAEDFSVQYPMHYEARLLLEDPSEELCRGLINNGYFLCMWKDERMSGGKLETAWAQEWQLDVRYKGAYIEEPVFWKQNENVSY